MTDTGVGEILAERRNEVLPVRIRRPDEANAAMLAMYAGLAAGLKRADRGSAIGAVVRTGNGNGFIGAATTSPISWWRRPSRSVGVRASEPSSEPRRAQLDSWSFSRASIRIKSESDSACNFSITRLR